MHEKKIKNADELKKNVDELKRNGKKIVYYYGYFDTIHLGHIQMLIEAKCKGDILIVGVAPDKEMADLAGRPFFNEEARMSHVAAIECVDYVILNEGCNAVKMIELLKPSFYVKEDSALRNFNSAKKEQKEELNLALEEELLKSAGGQLYKPNLSALPCLNHANEIEHFLSSDARIFVKGFKNEFTKEDVLNALKSLNNVKVLIIGDAILDEYCHCQQMDRAGKEALFTYRFLDSEIHVGGVFAVANHLAGFVNETTMLTAIGREHYNFVINNIKKNVEKKIFVEDGCQTLVKRRYLDQYKKSKLFEVYNVEGVEPNNETEEKILEYLKNNLHDFDMVLIADFGHGIMTQKIMDFLIDSNKFLAVNTQLNGGNRGYNFITKYKRADFVSLNDRELRYPLQEKRSDIRAPMNRLKNMLNLQCMNITVGKSGVVYYRDGEFYAVPAFTKDPVDTIGAGDAVLSITSLLSYKKVNPKITAFLGNCMGALAVKIVGNRASVDPIDLEKFILEIMK